MFSCSGCIGLHHRIPQAGGLEPWKFIFLQIWRHNVQGQGVVLWVSFWRGSLLCSQKAFLCPHAAFPIENTHKDATAAKFPSAECGLNIHLTKLRELNEIMYESDWQSTLNRVSPSISGHYKYYPLQGNSSIHLCF